MNLRVLLASTVAAMLVAGCVTSPTPNGEAVDVALPEFDSAAAVAAVRAAGAEVSVELDVQPLSDPEVTDLRQQAARMEAAGRLDAAAEALDDALELRPDDPLLLQERAELALLQNRAMEAAQLAARSHALGPQVGPLCRRQQEVLVQVARAQAAAGDADAGARAEAAAQAREACTVTPAPRY